MIGVLVSGDGSNLQALLDAELPVVAVASNREGVRALDRAGAAGVPAGAFELDDFDDREQRDATMADWLQEHGVRIVVCAGYMHVLTPPFLDRFPERIVNVHPSLLPALPRGAGDRGRTRGGGRETGVTVHLVDEGVDSGPVVRQEPVPVEPRETLVDRDPRGRAQVAARGGERAVRALISVYDKSGLDGFANGLASLDCELVASGGTAAYLEELGLPVTSVESS